MFGKVVFYALAHQFFYRMIHFTVVTSASSPFPSTGDLFGWGVREGNGGARFRDGRRMQRKYGIDSSKEI